MTPDEVRQIIREELQTLIASDRFTFQKNIQIFDARHIQLGKANGTKIGTEALQKIGFYGVTPIVQQGVITGPSGGGTAGVDNPARTVIAILINTLHNIGITA